MANGSLVYGSIDLSDEMSPFMADAGEAVSLGAPQSVTTALPRLLLDGESVSGDRSSNREVTFSIVVSGSDAVELADNEAALVAEANKPRNTLTWTPPGMSVPTVFDTFRAQLVHQFDDVTEVLQSRRTYQITIPALPFGRSQDLVSEDSLTIATTPITTVIDACDSTTGWTLTSLGSLSVSTTTKVTGTGALDASEVVSGDDGSGRGYGFWEHYLTRTGTIDMTGTPYLTVQINGASFPNLYADGARLTRLGSAASGTPGWTTWTFLCFDTTVSELRLEVGGGGMPRGATHHFYVDDLKKTNQLYTGGTTRESLRSIPVAGSVRTPGSLSVQHPSSALGSVLVYTNEDLGTGYQPDLRRWRTTGGTVTTDATLVSGASEGVGVGGTPTWEIPASSLPPGAYVMMVRILASAAGAQTLTAKAYTKMGANLVGTAQSVSSVVNLTTSYQMLPVGVLYLPPVSLSNGGAGSVQITLLTSGGTLTLDEAWLFHLDGVLTQVSCGTATPAAGGSSNRLWIDSPSVDQPLGGIWVGTQADRSDARSAGPDLAALGQHEFTPGNTMVYVVTTNALAPAVTMSHWPRWHTNAAS